MADTEKSTFKLSLAALRRLVAMVSIPTSLTEGAQGNTNRYPEWHSRRKTKGRRDASLKERSNRRKG